MTNLDKCLDELTKVESLLEKMELTAPEVKTKAESILSKVASFASKNKYLSGNFNYFSGIISFLNKDYKGALIFFSNSIASNEASGTSHGLDHLWKAYTHLVLNEMSTCYSELSLAYKKNKKITSKIKGMKRFDSIKENPEYTKALGIKANSELIDPAVKKLTDYVLESSNLDYTQFLTMIDREKNKIKDKASLFDAQIWVTEKLVDDAIEHELKDQDFYDESPYTLKSLKELLKKSKLERKKLGRGQSYFYKVTKNEAA